MNYKKKKSYGVSKNYVLSTKTINVSCNVHTVTFVCV